MRVEGLRPFPCLIDVKNLMPVGEKVLKYISNHLEVGAASIKRIPRRLYDTPDCTSEIMVGYARVSTEEQDLTAQRDAVTILGVEPECVYVDHGFSGRNKNRAGLCEALAACRAGQPSMKPSEWARKVQPRPGGHVRSRTLPWQVRK